MTIGIDIRSLQEPYGGIPEYTRALVRTLIEQANGAHRYILFTNAFHAQMVDGIPARGPYHEVCRLSIPNKLLHASIACLGRPLIDRLIWQRCGIRVDCLFFPNIHFIAHAAHIPRIVTVHDLSYQHCADLFSLRGNLWHRMTRPRALITQAAHVCAVSDATRRDVIRTFGIPESQITVTPLACPQGIPSRSAHRGARTLILLFGACHARKNAPAVLEGFSEFRLRDARARRYTLVLVGSARYRHTQRALIPDRSIQIRYELTRQQRAELYAHAAVLLYPSVTEGFGLPLLEAARSRVPIISANHSSIGEVIGTGAYYVNPFDSGEICRALQDVLGNNQLSESLVSDALCAARRFSWQETAKKTLDVFETVRRTSL